MKRSAEELTRLARDIIGDSTEDDVLSFYEDLADSVADSSDAVETETKLRAEMEELDKKWREKYRDRFLGIDSEEAEEREGDGGEYDDTVTIDDLFETKN